MKKLALLLLALPAVIATAPAQGIKLPPGVTVFAKGTGRTTGHVFNLYVQNNAGFSQKVTIPPVAIPSEGGRQGYVVPETVTVTVPANESELVPVRAFCTDHHLPAPAEGILLPRSSTWNPQSPIVLATQQIIRAIVDLQAGGRLKTSYSGDSGRELEIIAQHAVWVAGAPPDKPYTAADFCERMKREFTVATGTPVSALPPAFRQGLEQIWDAVTRAGRGAGVPALLPPPLPPSASQLTAAPPSKFPEITNTVKATGTGRTTGHIANLTVQNPTDRAVTVQFGPRAPSAPGTALFIPSSGQYQPYVIPYLPPVALAPGETKTIPVQGYCVDVRLPPVPDGGGLPPVNTWVSSGLPIPEPGNPAGSPLTVTMPTRAAPTLSQALDILPAATKPGTSLNVGCPDGLLAPLPTIPGTDTPLPAPVPFDKYPAVAIPLLLDAINRIIHTYDELQAKGVITTPFERDPNKQREAVIQQTFWIYSASLRGEPYEKHDFRANTIRQFEQNTGRTFAQIPQPQQEKMDEGVDDFWDSFEAVGAEAKILPRAPEPPKPVPGVDAFFNSTVPGDLKPKGNPTAPTPTDPRETVANPVEPPTLIKDDKNKGANCGCGKIKFDLHFFEMEQTAGGGWKSKDGSMTSASVETDGTPNPASHEVKGGQKNLKKGARIGVKLRNVVLDCPCSDGSECTIYTDDKEAAAHAAAQAELETLKKRLEKDLEKAEGDLKKAQADLAGNAKKQADLAEAKAHLAEAEKSLETAQAANEKVKKAQEAYDTATAAEKAAKGKEAKAAAKAAKEQAKADLDAVKGEKVSDTKMAELERKVKSAQEKVDKIEKPVQDAQAKVDKLKKEQEDAEKKVADSISGHPSIKEKAGGKDVPVDWDGARTDFNQTKDADNKKIEFSFYLGFYCSSTACKPVQCGRTFVVKVEE